MKLAPGCFECFGCHCMRGVISLELMSILWGTSKLYKAGNYNESMLSVHSAFLWPFGRMVQPVSRHSRCASQIPSLQIAWETWVPTLQISRSPSRIITWVRFCARGSNSDPTYEIYVGVLAKKKVCKRRETYCVYVFVIASWAGSLIILAVIIAGGSCAILNTPLRTLLAQSPRGLSILEASPRSILGRRQHG
jgi:hypothetical protein